MKFNGNAPLTGKALRTIREYLDLTLSEVAEEMSWGNLAYLCKIENGQVQASDSQRKEIKAAMLKAAKKRQRLIGSRLKELELTA